MFLMSRNLQFDSANNKLNAATLFSMRRVIHSVIQEIRDLERLLIKYLNNYR